jgi:Uma2 family endonuclease
MPIWHTRRIPKREKNRLQAVVAERCASPRRPQPVDLRRGVSAAIASRLGPAVRGGSCRAYIGDVKVRAADDVYYSPDVVVTCGSADRDPHVVSDPYLVVEVAPPSTEPTDRQEKAAAYKRMPSLQAYVIVFRDRRRAERHYRDPDGSWGHADIADRGHVPLPCPELRLTLDEIYQDVAFDQPHAQPGSSTAEWKRAPPSSLFPLPTGWARGGGH